MIVMSHHGNEKVTVFRGGKELVEGQMLTDMIQTKEGKIGSQAGFESVGGRQEL